MLGETKEVKKNPSHLSFVDSLLRVGSLDDTVRVVISPLKSRESSHPLFFASESHVDDETIRLNLICPPDSP